MATDWLTGFRRWAAEPSPVGEWVYRGQAAAYPQVLPSGLRDSHRPMLRHGLYDVDYDVAAELLRTSPVFSSSPLYPEMIDDAVGKQIEEAAYSLIGGPPTSDHRLSHPEVIRALAQHYGYATLFIDVSLNPLVAALFASHRWTPDGYVVQQEESVVFRWPAVRRSSSRLIIGNDTADDSVNVIDISRISPHMRRPYNQSAALATCVSDPKPVYQPFTSPASELEFRDMAELESCRTFAIPAGGGERLEALEGASMTSLFPDAIDLGYSYLALMALLSMLLPRAIDEAHAPWTPEQQRIKVRAMRLARAILDRECLRTVPGVPPPDSLAHLTVDEARRELAHLGEAARQAVELIGTEEIRRQLEPALESRRAALQQEAEKRHALWAKALHETLGPERAAEVEPPKPEYTLSMPDRPDWVRGQLEERLARVDSILATAEFVPVYALERPDQFPGHVAALPSNAAYETTVLHQLRAQQSWLASELFAANST